MFSMLKVLGIAFMAVVLLLYMHYLVGLDLFTDLLADAGIIIKTSTVLLGAIAIIVLAAAAMLLMTYSKLGKVSYTFLADRVSFAEQSAFGAKPQEIAYTNITSINVDKPSFANTLLKTGTLAVNLSGLDKEKISIPFIDNPEQVAAQLNTILNNYRAQAYTQAVEQKKVEGIMDQM